MANLKFSQFTSVTNATDLTSIVGYDGVVNQQIAPVPFIETGLTEVGASEKIIIGFGSGAALNGTNQRLVYIGYNVSPNGTNDLDNVGIGYEALSGNTTVGVDRCIAIGTEALTNIGNTGTPGAALNTIGIGYFAGRNITTATSNVCIGSNAGESLTTGNYNIAIGRDAMENADTQSNNIAIGREALELLDTGNGENVAIGYQSADTATNITQCTFLGSRTGDNTGTNQNITCIGYNAEPTSNSVDNEITLGDNNVSTLRCNTTTITALSDKRDKKDIKESSYGLDFINNLKPVTFEWDRRDGGRKGKDLGFIAQDLQEFDDEYTQLVYAENPDKLEATYGRLIPIMIKAIQDLKSQIEECKNCKNCKS